MTEPSRISIIGFGLMGAQISQLFAQHGYEVSAYDIDQSRLDLGLNLIKNGKYGLDSTVNKRRIDAGEAELILSHIKTSNSLEQVLTGAEFVLEAAIENLPTKQEVVGMAFQFASKEAVIATNTSTLSISKIGANLSQNKKTRLAGMHFFNPPQIMKLVEIVRTKDTADDVLAKIEEIALSLGKTHVTVFDSPGFIANRIGLSIFSEASKLFENGIASIRDIDISLKLGYGYPLGPFELGDMVGLDSRLRNMESMYDETHDERFKPPEVLKKLVAEGYLGDPRSKSGSKGGYYEYYGLKRPSEDTENG